MRALVIEHAPAEGPGRLGRELEKAGVECRHIRMYEKEVLPAALRDYDVVISLGGPMSVADRKWAWFLEEELKFLRQAAEQVPVLGICLGAQLLAAALGGRVMRAPSKETGIGEVFLTAAGRADPLWAGFPERFPVLQWHEDTFELPPGAELSATNSICPHQAFRRGRAYGVQFHLEADAAMVSEWSRGENLNSLAAEFAGFAEELSGLAGRMSANLLALMQEGRGEGKR